MRYKKLILNYMTDFAPINTIRCSQVFTRSSRSGVLGLVLQQQSNAIAILSSNGNAAFNESCSAIGLKACDSIVSQ